MRKLLALTLSLLLVFAAIPMTMVSADTMTATHVYTMDAGNRIAGGNTRYHWGAGYADIGGDHGYVFRLETKSDAYSYFTLPANWSTDYGKVTKISFELGGATKGTLYSPAVCLATAKDSNYKYSGTAIRGLWKNVEFKAGSWTTVEIDVSDKDTFFVDGTEARYMCLGAQKSLGVQNSDDSAKGWMYIDNVTLTYEYEADLPEYDVTIDGEVVDTVMETKTFTVPTPAEGYHYSDGVVDYFGGEEITVTATVALVSVINTYDVTVEGTVADTVAHGGTFTVPAPATGCRTCRTTTCRGRGGHPNLRPRQSAPKTGVERRFSRYGPRAVGRPSKLFLSPLCPSDAPHAEAYRCADGASCCERVGCGVAPSFRYASAGSDSAGRGSYSRRISDAVVAQSGVLGIALKGQ